MRKLIFNRVTKFIERLYRKVIVYASFIVIAIYGCGFIIFLIKNPWDINNFKMLLGSAAGTATLAGLSFYAGYMTPYDHKRPVFYDNGEQLYHATILFFVSLIVYSCANVFNHVETFYWLSMFFKVAFIFLTTNFFMYGLIITNIAVIRLLQTLHDDYRKLIDKNL